MITDGGIKSETDLTVIDLKSKGSLELVGLGGLDLALAELLDGLEVVLERAILYFFEVDLVVDFLVRAVGVLFLVPKNVLDLLVELLASVAHKQNLEGLLDGNLTLEGLVVHQKLREVEQLLRLVLWVESVLAAQFLGDDAPLVHGEEFVVVDIAVQIVVHLPDDLLDVVARGVQAQELEHASHVQRTDPPLLPVGLVLVVLGYNKSVGTRGVSYSGT